MPGISVDYEGFQGNVKFLAIEQLPRLTGMGLIGPDQTASIVAALRAIRPYRMGKPGHGCVDTAVV